MKFVNTCQGWRQQGNPCVVPNREFSQLQNNIQAFPSVKRYILFNKGLRFWGISEN